MNRRTNLTLLLGGAVAAANASAQATATPIQLHVDLQVQPGREQEVMDNFKKTFRPAIRKQPGFVDVKLLKLRTVPMGKAPEAKFRLLISFEKEEQRLTWVATDIHQKVWPTIEKTLKTNSLAVVLYDAV